MWFAEAGKYDVLPLDDRLPMEILMDERPSPFDAEGSYVFYPGTSDLPEHAAPNLRGRSFSIHATVELDEAAEGVLVAHGARFGGHSLFLKGGKLWYVNNFLGIPPEQALTSPDVIGVGAHVLSAALREGVGRRSQRGHRHGQAPGRREDRGRGAVAHPARPLRAVRRGALRRSRQRRSGEQGVRLRASRSPVAPSSRSRSSPATTSTWTSRQTAAMLARE